MKVLFHTDNSGQAYHRVHQPAKFITEPLNKQGIDITVAAGFNKIEDYDAYIINRLPQPGFMPYLEAIIKSGRKLIWTTDDDVFHLPLSNPAAKFYDIDAFKRIDYCCKNASYIISSTDYLKQVINAQYDTPTIVLPNLLDLSQWINTRHPHDKLRIVFAGSAFHNDDLNLIAPVIDEIVNEFDVFAIFFGDAPDRFIEWKRVQGDVIAQMMPKNEWNGRIALVRPVLITDFPQTLLALSPDIGICPLTQDQFNHSKSNLKFLEYSQAGAATIAQDMACYKNCKCLLAQNNWYELLADLIEHPDVRCRLAQEAKTQVTNDFSWQKKSNVWIEGFREMLK